MKSIYVASALFFMLFSCKNEAKQTEVINSEPEQVAVTPEMIERAKGIHERVITLDTHDDFNVNNFTDSINYTQNLNSQVTLPKMKAGGLDVAWFIVYTGQDTLSNEGYTKAHEKAMDKFNAIHRLVTDIAPEEIELAVSSDDVRRIHASGKKIAMIGIENGYPIGMDIKNVGKFYDLGGRYMSLSHNGHSQLSDSNTGEEDDVWLHNGLSPLGKEVVVEMNRLGMMIDVSHPSKEAMRQMIEISKAPIIASHSSARALCDHSRNLDDEQLQWLKDNGGVVQTVAFDAYLNTEKVEARKEALKSIQIKVADSMGVKWYNSREEVMALSDDKKEAFYEYYADVTRLANDKAKNIADFPPAVNVADFVDHIDYIVDKIGIEYVGISSDFDGGGGIEGWSDASETFNVTLELVRRGYTEAEISKLWSENLLRVLDKVQAIAKDLQNGKDS
ncbi:membrane dipeptidase [Bizionia argentinensis JUB59]|uniref:Membrane dipeptidase n=1 Tax=Bizionia argentinensis JUB59 TaxID=1046627 RepID=G2E9N4_9FLAO|nr:dipeptidase [Bizionia argentinensis]EGV45087.1 membrane dipeptidase [Bizionia argentinensis JUB59]